MSQLTQTAAVVDLDVATGLCRVVAALASMNVTVVVLALVPAPLIVEMKEFWNEKLRYKN